MSFRQLLCAIVALMGLLPATGYPAEASGQRVGVAKVDITPTDLIVNGTGQTAYEGVHDPIFARAQLHTTRVLSQLWRQPHGGELCIAGR